jgi:hypothetical protein
MAQPTVTVPRELLKALAGSAAHAQATVDPVMTDPDRRVRWVCLPDCAACAVLDLLANAGSI